MPGGSAGYSEGRRWSGEGRPVTQRGGGGAGRVGLIPCGEGRPVTPRGGGGAGEEEQSPARLTYARRKSDDLNQTRYLHVTPHNAMQVTCNEPQLAL